MTRAVMTRAATAWMRTDSTHTNTYYCGLVYMLEDIIVIYFQERAFVDICDLLSNLIIIYREKVDRLYLSIYMLCAPYI